ncbi:MAG: DUF4384 domain-containing protein [Elusimicrobia bacterium]|nr:DUF4384 domain-containing protein [Elusimicrobiota bacterium]
MNDKARLDFIIPLLLALAPPLAWAASGPDAGEGPAWLSKTVIPKEDFIYAVGRSQPQKTEKEAKDEAVTDATQQFVKYCGVSVEGFLRSYEAYSKENAAEETRHDVASLTRLKTKAFVSRAVPEEWHVVKRKKEFEASVLLKVPKEEFDRISRERNVKLSLDVLFYYEGEDGKMKALSEGSVLRSGDGYAVYLRPSDDCHLYVFQVDALGKTFRLFPNPEFKTAANPVATASDLWIPNDRSLYTLDETTGRERFFVFGSLDTIAEFEGEDPGALTIKDLDNVVRLKKMGMAGLKPKQAAARVAPPKRDHDVVAVKRKLQAEGAFVYETWFWHK